MRHARLVFAMRLAMIAAGGGVAVATGRGTFTPASLAGLHADRWLALALFTLAAMVAETYPIRVGDDTSYVLSDAAIFAGALLLPPGLLSLMCVAVGVVGALHDPRAHRWFKASFNTATWLLGAQAASALVAATGAARADGPVAVAWLVAAIVVNVAIIHLLISATVSLESGIPPHKLEGNHIRYLAVDGLIQTMGVLSALLWAAHPWAVALMLAPLTLPYWLLKGIQLVRLADIDPKTSLHNHRYFERALSAALTEGARTARPVAILFADQDYLRAVNNAHGHLAGDAVLRQLADVLRAHMRQKDTVARWGGEEFVAILPGTDLDTAVGIAERLRADVAAHPFDVGGERPLRCTTSIGVAAAPAHGWDREGLLGQADRAVYAAKAQGRDRVCVAPDTTPGQGAISDGVAASVA